MEEHDKLSLPIPFVSFGVGQNIIKSFSLGVRGPSPLSVSGFGAPQSKIFSAICGHYREKAAFGNESVSVLGQREMGEGGTPVARERGRVFERRKRNISIEHG